MIGMATTVGPGLLTHWAGRLKVLAVNEAGHLANMDRLILTSSMLRKGDDLPRNRHCYLCKVCML